MAQRRKQLTPDRSAVHLWGSELRAWRDRRDLSLARLGELIRYNPSYLARIERGERTPPKELADAVDRALNASGALIRLWERIDNKPNDTRHANDVANFSRHVANGRDVLATMPDFLAESEEAGIKVPCRTQDGRIIFVTLPRRTFLSGMGLGALAAGTAGPSASAQTRTLGTSHTSFGPDLKPVEHFRQLRRVLIDNDNLLGPLRVIPTVEGQIDAIRQLRQVSQGVDARELLYVQTQFAELSGWLHQDAGNFRSAQYWTDRALEWSYATGVPDLTTFILARKSQLAADMRDGVTAIDLAQAARAQARPETKLGAIAATNAAYGFALMGDIANTNQMLDQAHDLLSSRDTDPSFSWGSWMDDAYIEVQRARSLSVLGRHNEAAEGFRTAIDALPATYHRDRGVYLARESLAYAGAKEPQQAATVGLQALAIAEATASARIVTELTHLDHRLDHWSKVPEVAQFRETLDGLLAHQT